MTVEELINELSKVEDKTMEVNFPYSHGTQENGNPMNVDSISVFDDCVVIYIRLAKKIMKQKNYLCLPYDSISDYWYAKVINFEDKAMFHVMGKYDHRIIKAISLTSKKRKI